MQADLWVSVQSELHRDTLFKKKKKMQGQSLVSYAVFRNSFRCYVIFREHVRGRPLKHSACCCTWSHTCQHMVTVSWSHASCPLSHVWVWICLLHWLDFQLIIHFTYGCCVPVCEYHVSVHATAHTWRSNILQHTCGGPTCHSTHVEVQHATAYMWRFKNNFMECGLSYHF